MSQTKLQLRKVKLPATGTSIIATVFNNTLKDKDKWSDIDIRVSFKSVDESLKQDALSFPLLRRIARKRHMNLILPEGAKLEAHKQGDAYGDEGKTYATDGHHVDLPTYTNDEGEVKPSAFMEFEWRDTEEAEDYQDNVDGRGLKPNRIFVPLIADEDDSSEDEQF